MTGFTEDILNGLARDIEQNWEKHNGDIEYFIDMVTRTPYITPKDLNWYIHQHGDHCHEGVNHVFAAIVYAHEFGCNKKLIYNKNVKYLLESFLYPAHVSRIELERGTEDWPTIRRHQHELATSRNETVMLSVYNHYRKRWDYIGKVLPSGEMYDWRGHGPFLAAPDYTSYQLKGGDQ